MNEKTEIVEEFVEEIADVVDDGTCTRIELDNENLPVLMLALSMLAGQLQGSEAADIAGELLYTIDKQRET